MIYIISILLGLTLLNGDLSNPSFERVTAKHKSQKNSECNIFIEINNNNDWEKYKYELNTIFNKNTPCKEILIYKSIKNVKIKDRNSKEKEFDLNIGTIINNPPYGLKIKTIIHFDNVDISSNSYRSKVNYSTQIKKDTGYISNISIDNKTKINNSTIGKKYRYDTYKKIY